MKLKVLVNNNTLIDRYFFGEPAVSYFKKWQPARVHACHCTDFNSKLALSGVVELKEVGVGLEFVR